MKTFYLLKNSVGVWHVMSRVETGANLRAVYFVNYSRKLFENNINFIL